MSLVFDRTQLEHKLAGAATEVLETMFFSSVDGETDLEKGESSTPFDARIGAYLEFHGACTGRLALSLEKEAAESLALNFFGSTSEHGPESDSRSVMAELANMVCGAMLSHLDKHSIFCLDSPQQLASNEEADGEIVRVLRLEDGLLRLALSLDEAHLATDHASSRKVDVT